MRILALLIIVFSLVANTSAWDPTKRWIKPSQVIANFKSAFKFERAACVCNQRNFRRIKNQSRKRGSRIDPSWRKFQSELERWCMKFKVERGVPHIHATLHIQVVPHKLAWVLVEFDFQPSYGEILASRRFSKKRVFRRECYKGFRIAKISLRSATKQRRNFRLQFKNF